MSYEGYLGSSIDHGDIWLIYDKEHIYDGVRISWSGVWTITYDYQSSLRLSSQSSLRLSCKTCQSSYIKEIMQWEKTNTIHKRIQMWL